MKRILVGSAAALCLCLAVAANAANCSTAGNVLVDPGFELQTPAASGGWISFGGVSSTAYPRTGQWSQFVSAFNNVTGSFEQFPAAPGSQWRLAGYGLAVPSPLLGIDSFGLVQVTFIDIFGNDLGTVETAGNTFPAKTSNPVDGTAPGWNYLDTETATAPEGAAYILAFTLYIDFSGIPNGQGVYFDDLNLQVLGVNHGGYVSSIAHNAGVLKRAGLLTGAQQAAMIEAAAKSNGGKQRDCAAAQ